MDYLFEKHGFALMAGIALAVVLVIFTGKSVMSTDAVVVEAPAACEARSPMMSRQAQKYFDELCAPFGR